MPSLIAVGDLMFLVMQDFDFAQILIALALICRNFAHFLGGAAPFPAPMTLLPLDQLLHALLKIQNVHYRFCCAWVAKF